MKKKRSLRPLPENIAERYGFSITSIPANSPIVALFFQVHLKTIGLPLDTKPQAQWWYAVTKDKGVYCVFGYTRMDDGSINVSDFYTYGKKWGTLACYAALERIRFEADASTVPIVTATPLWNAPMIRAYKRAFNVERPSMLVFIYSPKRGTIEATSPQREPAPLVATLPEAVTA